MIRRTFSIRPPCSSLTRDSVRSPIHAARRGNHARAWKTLMSLALLLSLALLSAGAGRAQGSGISYESGQLKQVRAQRISEPPKFDVVVDEPFWAEITPASGFVQQNPDEGAAATEKTEVRIAFDDKNLYFGVICFDSQPQNIVMTQNRLSSKPGWGLRSMPGQRFS